MIKINELEATTLLLELSDQESSLFLGGHPGNSPLLTIGCPGNGKPVHKHYPDGTWGSICVYDDPDPLPEPPPFYAFPVEPNGGIGGIA